MCVRDESLRVYSFLKTFLSIFLLLLERIRSSTTYLVIGKTLLYVLSPDTKKYFVVGTLNVWVKDITYTRVEINNTRK